MKLRQGCGIPGTDAGAMCPQVKGHQGRLGATEPRGARGFSSGGGAADISFLAFCFQAVRDAEGSYCCTPGAEVTGGSATGPYNSFPMCHTYYGLQKVVWGAEANDFCGWAPGTKVRLRVLSTCCPDPTPAKRGKGSPEEDEGVRDMASARSWFAPPLPVWRDTNDLLANGKHRFITPDV